MVRSKPFLHRLQEARPSSLALYHTRLSFKLITWLLIVKLLHYYQLLVGSTENGRKTLLHFSHEQFFLLLLFSEFKVRRAFNKAGRRSRDIWVFCSGKQSNKFCFVCENAFSCCISVKFPVDFKLKTIYLHMGARGRTVPLK